MGQLAREALAGEADEVGTRDHGDVRQDEYSEMLLLTGVWR